MAGNLVGGLVQSLTKTPVTVAQQVANQALPGPTFQESQVQATQAEQMLSQLDNRIATKIGDLRMAVSQGDKTAEAKITRLQNFVAERNQTVIPQEIVPAGLDKTPKEMAWDAAEMGASLLLLGTNGIFEVPYFKASREALLGATKAPNLLLGITRAPLTFAAQRGAVLTGLAAENALFAAIFSASSQSKDPKFDVGKFLQNTALGTVAGTALSYGATVGFGRMFKGESAFKVAEFSKDMVEVADARAARGVDELRGFDRESHYNIKGTKIAKPVNLQPEISVIERGGGVALKPPDFSTPQVGDVVRTAEGLRGVIGSVNYPVNVGSNEGVLKSLLGERSTLTTEYESIARSSAGGPIATLQKDRLETLAERLKTIDKYVEEIQKDAVSSGVDLTRKDQTIELIVKNSSGDLVSVYLPETSLTNGGQVLERERLVPTNFNDLAKNSPAAAKELAATADEMTQSQLARNRATVKTPEGVLPIPSTGANMSDAEMLAAGNTGLRPDFVPNKVTKLAQFFKETSTLEKSGVNAAPLVEAERALDRERASLYGQIRELMKPVLAEAGLPERLDSVGGLLKLATNGAKRQQLSALSERLFEAANGDIAIDTLTGPQQALVRQWQSTAHDLLDRINSILVARGKEPIQARTPYITNVLTAQARAALETYGAIPNKLLGELFGPAARQLYSKGLPKNVQDALLKSRTGGLPIEKDFFRASSAAIDTHLRFIHFQPAVDRVAAVLKRVEEVTGGIPRTNRSIIEGLLKKLTGQDPKVDFLRAFDQKILDFLTAEKWFPGQVGGVKNIFRNFFGEYLKTESGMVFVPKKNLLNKIEKYGIGQLPRNIKRVFYDIQMAFNIPFGVLNLTQFWALAVPRLRGNFVERYSAAFEGFGKALTDVWSSKKWDYFTDKNILTEVKNYEMLELGARPGNPVGYGGAPAGVLVGKALNTVTEMTEFINRVSSYHAAYGNMIKNPEYYPELNKLTGGELYRKAEELAHKLSETANFKYGVTHRAPIQDDPFLSLWDQFNSYFRNWVGSTQEMWRNFKGDPEGEAAIKELFDGKGFKRLAAYMQHPDTLTGKRGEIIRFVMNGSLLLAAGAAVGGSLNKGVVDMYMGGGPRFADGLVNLMKGILNDDQAKVDKSLQSILLPPSIPPTIDAATGLYQFLSGKEKFTFKRALVDAPYSPLKKINHSLEVAKAALTGQPVPIKDGRTGKVLEVVDPKNAAAELLFGYRSYSVTQHFKEMDEISSLNAKADQQARERSREANAILDELMAVPEGVQRSEKWDLMVAAGRIDPQIAQEIIKQNRETKLLMSDTVIRQLKALPAEYRVEFMKNAMRGMDEKQRKDYALHLAMSGAVTPVDAAVAVKEMKDAKPKDLKGILYVLGAAAVGLGVAALAKGRVGVVENKLITEGSDSLASKMLGGLFENRGIFKEDGRPLPTFEQNIDHYVHKGLLDQEAGAFVKKTLSGLEEQFKKVGVENRFGVFSPRKGEAGVTVSPTDRLLNKGVRAPNEIFIARDLKGQPLDTALTLIHEMGHASYYTLLSKEEKDIIHVAYKAKSTAEWADYFQRYEGRVINYAEKAGEVSAMAKYGASNVEEFFAEAFKQYAITRQTPAPELKTIFDRLISYMRTVWSRISGNAQLGSPEQLMSEYINPLIEEMFQGKTLGISERTMRVGGEAYSRGLKKDMMRYVQMAEDAGWRVEHTGGGHIKLLSPDKTKPPVFTSSTPEEPRSVQNFLSQLKRAGLDLKDRPPKPGEQAR